MTEFQGYILIFLVGMLVGGMFVGLSWHAWWRARYTYGWRDPRKMTPEELKKEWGRTP